MRLGELLRSAAADLSRSTAFVYRNYHLTRRYLSWFMVMVFYSVVGGLTVVLIGVASGDRIQTMNLLLGVLMWSFLSSLFQEISQNVAYERWEGTIEYTFMAPVSTFSHLLGVSAFAALLAAVRAAVVLAVMAAFVDIDLSHANLGGAAFVILLASISFLGLGLIAATLPIVSAENGAQATHILEGLILLVSGVYYPVAVLPAWLQPFSALSPATYALDACRRLLGIEGGAAGQAAALVSVGFEIKVLAVLGVFSVPLGLWIFKLVENWAKRTGRLKRSG